MKILILLLFPFYLFGQVLPPGKYLKVKDDGSGFELVTLSAVTSTKLADSTAALRTAMANYLTTSTASSTYALSNHTHAGVYQPVGSYSLTSHTHPYNTLTGLPTLFDGAYNSLTGKPTLFTQATADGLYSVLAHTHTGVYQPVGSYLVAADIVGKLNTNGDGSSLTGLTKSQVSLGNVDNTSDVTKNAAAVNITNKTIATFNYAVDAQATDSYVISLSPAPAAYTTGMIIFFKANTVNTGAASLNVNSLGAKTIVKRVNTVLTNADIAALGLCMVIYDGTNFVLLNPVIN